MLNYHHIVLYLLCLNEAASRQTHFTDFYVDSVKVLYPNSRFFNVTATLKRSGHENPKLSFEIDLFDAVRNYDGDIKLYYSPIGNRRYMLLPYKVERRSICDSMEFELAHRIFQTLQNYSNMPLPVENIQLCELLTLGHYYVHNFMIDKSVFPQITPTGRFRMVTSAYERTKKEPVQAVEYVATFV